MPVVEIHDFLATNHPQGVYQNNDTPGGESYSAQRFHCRGY